MWWGFVFVSASRAKHLMFGSLTAINLESRFIVSFVMSSVKEVSYFRVRLIASNKMLWSELFLLTCFVTSVVRNTFLTNLPMSEHSLPL
jgi:hypothetical protein